MKTTNNIISNMLLGLFAAMLFAGCQKELDSCPTPQQRSVTIEISVSTEEVVRSTPNAMESVVASLRVYAFYNGKKAGYVYRQSTVSGTPLYMDLNLPETGKHDVQFYVIANENEMAAENGVVQFAEDMTPSQLEQVSFTGLDKGVALPMYDKRTESIDVDAIQAAASTAEGHEGHFVLSQKITFMLHRPIAKLSFYAAKAATNGAALQINSVEFLASGTRLYNYLFPQEDATLNQIPSRANGRAMLTNSVTVGSSVAAGGQDALNPANYTEVVSNVYLSEVAVGSSSWDVPSSSSNAGVLRIEYATGEPMMVKNAYVYLPAIERNHHIKVCALFNSAGDINVNYEVADWDDYQMPDYHFDYPTHSFLMETLPTTENLGHQPTQPATMSENNPFVGYFQMSKPSNDAWTPTRLGLNGNNCEIIVYDVETNQEITTFPVPASDKWYRIEMWPLGGKMEVGDEVMLAISYQASGLSESEFLLINGSANNYYWPYQGSSIQDANYVIITMEN